VLYWEPDGANLSLKNFAALLSDPRFYQAAGNTVLCGAGATFMSCLLGFSLAWIVSRTDLPDGAGSRSSTWCRSSSRPMWGRSPGSIWRRP